jgi:hypothetical protein
MTVQHHISSTFHIIVDFIHPCAPLCTIHTPCALYIWPFIIFIAYLHYGWSNFGQTGTKLLPMGPLTHVGPRLREISAGFRRNFLGEPLLFLAFFCFLFTSTSL